MLARSLDQWYRHGPALKQCTLQSRRMAGTGSHVASIVCLVSPEPGCGCRSWYLWPSPETAICSEAVVKVQT
jgi:hypothetical protein